jgi:hypothetical protein
VTQLAVFAWLAEEGRVESDRQPVRSERSAPVLFATGARTTARHNGEVAEAVAGAIRRHAREPHELAAIERADFFSDLVRAGEALERAYAADKVNNQILGNLVPHLHAHIRPPFLGDAYPGQPVSGAPA